MEMMVQEDYGFLEVLCTVPVEHDALPILCIGPSLS
jgi:hypothetical protein